MALVGDAVVQAREEQEPRRRIAQVRDQVRPPADVSIGQLDQLSFEEKATKMFPQVVEQIRRRVAAPLNPPPRNDLGWWKTGYRP